MPRLVNHLYRFGEFVFDADQKVLLRQGQPLPLAPKVVETLLTLIQNSGRIIEKQELMTRLWPDTYVEESNLTYTIVQLRKRGLEWTRRALALDSQDPNVLYNAACAFSISGEFREAITCLEKSLPFCADRKWLDHDSYLDPLRSHPRFQELLRVDPRSASHA